MPEQFPSHSTDEYQRPDRPAAAEYRFIYADHIAAAFEQMAEGLQDVDIIAYEPLIADTTEQQREISSAVNTVFAEDTTSSAKQVAKEFVELHDDSGLLYSFLERFEGSGKRFFLIDMAADDPRYYAREHYADTRQKLRVAIADNLPNSEVKSKIEAFIYAIKGAAIVQEPHMASQLQEIGEANPGETVGVVMGATHTPVRHAIARQAHTEKRLAILGKNLRYTYEDEAARALRMGKMDEIPADILNKALLQEFFSAYARPGDDIPHLGLDKQSEGLLCGDIDIYDIAAEVIDNIPSSELETILERAQAIRTTRATWLSRRSEALGKRNEMNSLLNEQVDRYGVSQQNHPE